MAKLDNSRHLVDVGGMREQSDLTSLNVSLPKSQRAFVETEAARSGCTTSSEYIRRLIHDAQRRSEQEELERKLIAGLESGEPIGVSPEYWEKKRRELAERHSRKPS
jgi:Arc/MetJ-type ribon-helix-helix transcriptional regulator